MKRHEVTDEQWEVIQAVLPKRTAKTGRPPSDSRLMLNGILWILRTGLTPSPNLDPGLVRESSCPVRGWKGFSDEEATQYRADRGPASSG